MIITLNKILIMHWVILCFIFPQNIGKTGAIIDRSKNINDEAKYFYLDQLRNTFNQTKEFEIRNVAETDYEYAHIKRSYGRISKDFSEVSQAMEVRYLFISTVTTGAHSIKLDISVYDRYIDDFIFDYSNTGAVKKFSDIVQLFTDFYDKWNNNKSIVSIDGSPKNTELIFFNNFNQKLPIGVFSTPLSELTLNPGKYTLSLSKKGYRDFKFNISLLPGNKHQFQYSMVPYDKFMARSYALAFPGLGHSYIDKPYDGKKWKRRGIGMVVTTALSCFLYLDASQTYDDLYTEYSAKRNIIEIKDARDKLEPAMNAKNTALSIFVSASATTLVTWIWNYFDLNRKLEKL